jgi:hypothetical protein
MAAFEAYKLQDLPVRLHASVAALASCHRNGEPVTLATLVDEMPHHTQYIAVCVQENTEV